MKIITLAEKADDQKAKDSEEPTITKEFEMIPVTEFKEAKECDAWQQCVLSVQYITLGHFVCALHLSSKFYIKRTSKCTLM